MRILIDIRALQEGKITGVTTYVTQLLSQLFKKDTNNEYILFVNKFRTIPQLPEFNHTNVHIVRTHIPNKLLNLSCKLLKWPKIDKLATKKFKKRTPFNIDLVFTPDPRLTPVSKGVKKITTFHDLSFNHFPQNFSFTTRLYHRLLNPKSRARDADHIIAVSEFTKEDLKKTYKIHEDNISVIHEGVDRTMKAETDETKLQSIKIKYNLPNSFFLALFTLDPRKNIHGLIKAFSAFKKEHENEYKLVIAGKADPKLFSLGVLPEHDDIIFTGFIDEEDKASLYTLASAFIYPSFYEGFGLPLLEAMKCKTPVITSNTSALPEILGMNGDEVNGILVDPYDIVDIAKKMETMVKNLEQCTEKIENAYQRAHKMNWERCAEQHLKLFEKISQVR